MAIDFDKLTLTPGLAPEEVDRAMTEAGIPELPVDLVERARNMEERELLIMSGTMTLEGLQAALRIIDGLRKRCAACLALNDGNACPLCAADHTIIVRLLANLMALTRVVNTCLRPNSRVAAAREAAAEQKKG